MFSNEKPVSQTEKLKIHEAIRRMVDTHGVETTVTKLICTAKAIASSLPRGGELHCFITSASMGNRNKFELFPIASNLFHDALCVSNPKSDLAAQAIRDVFLIAYRVNRPTFPVTMRDNSIRIAQRNPIVFPRWFPYKATKIHPNFSSNRTQYLLCHQQNMEKMSKLEVAPMATLYNSFFRQIWAQGCIQRKISGQISYAMLTPPWLRDPLVFKYGPGRG